MGRRSSAREQRRRNRVRLAVAAMMALPSVAAAVTVLSEPPAAEAATPTIQVEDQTVELGTRPKLPYTVGNTGGKSYKVTFQNMSTKIAKVDQSGYINTYSTGTATTSVTVTINGTGETASKTIRIKVVNAAPQPHVHEPGQATHENEKAAGCLAGGSYDEVVRCSSCGEELSRVTRQTPALGHDFGDWATGQPATCTNGGTEVRTCRRCGQSETRETAALGHIWGNWQVTQAAQPGVAGQQRRVCQRDGSHVETAEIPALPVQQQQQQTQQTQQQQQSQSASRITPTIVVTDQVVAMGTTQRLEYEVTNTGGNRYRVRFQNMSPAIAKVDGSSNIHAYTQGTATVVIVVEDGGSGALGQAQAKIRIQVVASQQQAESMRNASQAHSVASVPVDPAQTGVDPSLVDDIANDGVAETSEALEQDAPMTEVPDDPAIADQNTIPAGQFVYVDAKGGNDKSRGSMTQPVKTIKQAFALIVQYRKDKSLSADKEVIVALRGGTHVVDDATGKALGKKELANVRILGFQGEKAIVTKAQKVSEFKQETVNGITVYSATVSKDAVSAYADVESDASGGRDVRVATYPDDKWLVPWKEVPFVPENKKSSSSYTPVQSWEFLPFKDDITDGIRNIKETDDTRVRILTKWHDDYARVEYKPGLFFDLLGEPSLHLVKDGKQSLTDIRVQASQVTDKKTGNLTSNGSVSRYRFENAKFALSQPGEYCLVPTREGNKDMRKLYYVPYKGESTKSVSLYVASPSPVFTIGGGASKVSFENVCVGYTGFTNDGYGERSGVKDTKEEGYVNTQGNYQVYGAQGATTLPGAIALEQGASNVSFLGCDFFDIGSHAIRCGKKVSDVSIDQCEFDGIGGSAVLVGGGYTAPLSRIYIRNNRITGYGQTRFGATGIQILYCVDSAVTNNEISEGHYSGISCGWQWGYDKPDNPAIAAHPTKGILIANNLIHDLGQENMLADMGGIYTLGPQPGTQIRNNIVYNIRSDKTLTCRGQNVGLYGGIGIYLDEGSSGITVDSNLVYSTTGENLFIHYGEGNTFKNNVAVMDNKSQSCVLNVGQNVQKIKGRMPNSFIGNVLVGCGDKTIVYHMDKDIVSTGTPQQKNVVYNRAGTSRVVKDGLGAKVDGGTDAFPNDFVYASPLFRNINGGDYTPKANLAQYGFVPFECTTGMAGLTVEPGIQ